MSAFASGLQADQMTSHKTYNEPGRSVHPAARASPSPLSESPFEFPSLARWLGRLAFFAPRSPLPSQLSSFAPARSGGPTPPDSADGNASSIPLVSRTSRRKLYRATVEIMKRRSPRVRTNLRNPAHCANRHYPACGNLAEQRPATPNLAFFVPPVQRARALEIYRVNDERLYPREIEKRDEENGRAKGAGDPRWINSLVLGEELAHFNRVGRSRDERRGFL